MELRNCMLCGKAFVYTGGKPICPDCRREIEEAYEKVRVFLRDHPKIKLSISELAELTGVEEDIIIILVEEGRIDLEGAEGLTKRCAKCGVPIESGTYCPKCAAELKLELLGKKGPDTDKKQEPKKEEKKKDKVAMYMVEVLKKKKK